MAGACRARPTSLTRLARAKVNLTLHVVGRRADGYHELNSLVAFADFGDRLRIGLAETLELTLAGPFAPALEDCPPTGNLALVAARRLKARFAVAGGAQIHLEKHIPVAAGLGGGSADAAAVLEGLVELWGLDPPPGAMAALAAEIGADVPVCLAGRCALVSGIGERLRPLTAFPAAWLLLVNPGRPLATAAVFAAFVGPGSAPQAWDAPIGDLDHLVATLAQGANDLEAPALRLLPEIGEVLAALRGQDGCLLARMSGSGPTCYGIFAEARAAARAAARLAAIRPGWWLAEGRLAAVS
jgi:4-diphosphocytidyl-2-C-methyl-D-erythritol kinase